MSVFLTLLRRQLMSYFLSPGYYVGMAVFLFVAGVGFGGMISQSLVKRFDAGDILFGSNVFQIAILAIIAFITMSLFAEERNSGTMEMLLTAPVTDTQVVMAKYAGALIFFGILSAPTVLNVMIIKIFNAESGSLDLTAVGLGYGMFFLTTACYIAIGLFMSSLTRSQLLAGVLSFSCVSMMFFAAELRSAVFGGGVNKVLEYVSGSHAILAFGRGIVDTRPVVFCVSCSVVFLFAAVKALEARQWK